MKSQKISLIVTVKNDAKGLAKLITSLHLQTRLPDEVCLSVAASTDNTLVTAKELSTTSKFDIHVIPCGLATRSEGRNLAVERATGDLLVFTDVGCFPDQHWIKRLVAPFSDSSVALVSGLTLGDPQNLWEEVQVPYVLVSPEKITDHPLPATRNMAMTKATWDKVGPFLSHLNFAEDFEWSRRAASLGVLSTFAPDAIVRWRPRATPWKFFTMIHHLAMGDILAGTWRSGHLSMWGRYIIFTAVVMFVFTINPVPSLFGGTTIWFNYAAVKASRFHFSKKQTYWYVPLAQLLADLAVLTGTARGLALRVVSGQNRGKV